MTALVSILSGLPWSGALGWLSSYFLRRQEHAQRVELLRLEHEGKISAAAEASFAASQAAAAAESGDGVWVWVRSMRYATRFLLTYLLVLAAVILAFREIGAAPRLVGLAEMALGWWFGSRAGGVAPRK